MGLSTPYVTGRLSQTSLLLPGHAQQTQTSVISAQMSLKTIVLSTANGTSGMTGRAVSPVILDAALDVSARKTATHASTTPVISVKNGLTVPIVLKTRL